ncbi:MAG: molecular chaperone DnaK, partial [Methanothrix sp.]|nr:molecular chaperone DnaK [Methanothrix sp.]
IAEIKAKTDALQNIIYELSTAMYQKAAQQQQQQAQQGQGPDQGPSSGNSAQTVDADYEVVNDKK